MQESIHVQEKKKNGFKKQDEEQMAQQYFCIKTN